jgi:hypothetical protein
MMYEHVLAGTERHLQGGGGGQGILTLAFMYEYVCAVPGEFL